MAKTVKVKNPVIPQKEETFLTAKYTSGTSLSVKNNEGWSDNDHVVVGLPGRELTELGDVSGVSGNETITLDSALKFDHGIDAPLFRSAFDQIAFEKKASGGSFAEVAKYDIQWDEQDGFTKITVSDGVDSDTYRWRFYSTLTGLYSDYSGELPGTGLTQFHAGYLVAIVRQFGKMPAFEGITDLFILHSLNRGQRQIDTQAPDGKWWFALTEDVTATRVQAVANTYKYDLPSSFRAMDVIQVLDTNSQRYNLSYEPRQVFDSFKTDDANESGHSDSTRQWTLLTPDSTNTVGYFGVHPTPLTADNYYYRRYWRFLPELTSFASITLVPLPEMLINYAMYEVYKLREDAENAQMYYTLFKEGLQMLNRLQRRQVGQSQLLWWRGQTGFADLFGNLGSQSIDTIRENYW